MTFDMNWGTLKPVSTFGLQDTGAPGLRMPAASMPSYMGMDGYGVMPPTDYSLGTSQVPGFGLQSNNFNIAPTNLVGGGAAPGGGGGWNWLSTRDQQGVLGPALQGIGALGSLYLGMKQYGLAKETLANNKAQFERNFEAQKTTTNASLEDRQRARVASNAGAYQSVGDYMNQNGVR